MCRRYSDFMERRGSKDAALRSSIERGSWAQAARGCWLVSRIVLAATYTDMNIAFWMMLSVLQRPLTYPRMVFDRV